MRSKTQPYKKLMKIITCPIKGLLSKARDVYVKCMVGCAERAGYNGHAVGYQVGQFSSLPRSCSQSSTRSWSGGDEDTRELIRAASARTLGETSVGVNVIGRERELAKSSSVAVMGRIDEDSTCEFEFGDAAEHGNLYSRRSRSYAVGNRNHVF